MYINDLINIVEGMAEYIKYLEDKPTKKDDSNE
jgi:hypothetical protein